ncbi:MAG TPA: hypothetical protein VGF55_16730 [Gemmataceae bacterium]|jgi:hypothetical protein
MKELFHAVGPDEVFGADEALGIEVQAIPCQEGIDAIRAWAAAKKAAEAKAAESPADAPQVDPDRPAA